MRITVAQLWKRPVARTAEFVFDHTDGADPENSLLYLPVPSHSDVTTLDTYLKRLSPALVRGADKIVFRMYNREHKELMSQPRLISLIALRLEKQPTSILRWDGNAHRLSPLWRAKQRSLADGRTLSYIRRAELLTLLDTPGALLPKASDFHYEGPDGNHYSNFVRVATALEGLDSLDAVIFWLLPYVVTCRSVVVDSRGMLSLALRIPSFLREIGGESRDLAILSPSYYAERAAEIRHRLLALKRERDISPVLLIESLTSGGNLKERLKYTCRGAHLRFHAVSLFALNSYAQEHPTNVFCPIDDREDFLKFAKENCSLCRAKSAVVPINPVTYVPEISASASIIKLSREILQQAGVFFHDYHGLGCFAVHRDQHDRARHHMIDIDVAPLLDHPKFVSRLEANLEDIKGKVEVIICPNHPRAILLAEKVSRIVGSKRTFHCDEIALRALAATDRAFREAKSILVVDDVMISGARLLGYRRLLSAITSGCMIGALVAVAQCPSDRTRRGVANIFSPGLKLRHPESILLPDWGEGLCPWCIELQQLELASHQLSDLPSLKARADKLANKSRGISDDIFMRWEDPPDHFRLGDHSLLGPASMSHAEAFAAVASALQLLRNKKDLDEEYRPPVAKVLGPEYWLEGTLFDCVLTASVLRASRRHDLRSTPTESELIGKLNSFLPNESHRGVRSELLLAIAQSKLPWVPSVDDQASRIFGGEVGACTFLRTLLGRRGSSAEH